MVLDTTRDVVHKSLLAMLGAITLADDEIEQLLDRLAARGKEVARDQLSHVEAVRNRLIGDQRATREVGHEGRILQQTLQEEIERRGRLLAAALDLPTRDSITLLHEQVDRIGKALDQILASRAPVVAPAGDGHLPVVEPVERTAVAPSEPKSAVEVEAESSESGALAERGVSAVSPAEPVTGHETQVTAEAASLAPVPGYDALNAKQAAALVHDLDEETLIALKTYEQANRNRVTVLRAIELALASRGTSAE